MIGSVAWFLFCAALGIGSVKVAVLAIVARRRRKYQRCLARIKRLEVELGYRKGPTTYADVLRDMHGLRRGLWTQEFDARGLPRVYAPAGSLRKTQWTDEELTQRRWS